MRARIANHVRKRGGVFACAVCAAAIGRTVVPSPGAPDLDGLAGMLGAASDTRVATSEIGWEPSSGTLVDAILGRHVLFLGALPDGPREVFRATARVSFEGKPIAVSGVRNLTNTRVGDDVGLTLSGHHAAFATVAFERIQAVTILDLDGIAAQDQPPSWFDRALLAVNSVQMTLTPFGIGQTDVIFDVPPPRAEIRFQPDGRLRVGLGDERRDILYDPSTRGAVSAAGGEPYAAKVIPKRHRHKPLVLWAVDTVREEVGPEPIAWLEHRVFGVRDAFKRTTYAVMPGSDAPTATLKGPTPEAKKPSTEPDAAWPPHAIPSLWKERKAGEGEWQEVKLPWVKAIPVPPGTEAPPPYFYQTFTRPDPERPWVEMMLVAMDMRQLELHMEAGYEDPQPLTGPAGRGHLPAEPSVLRSVVATFNGAFKTTHGEYGMMVDKRVLLPPMARAATVVVDERGDAGFGNWPENGSIPSDVISFRQNLDPLVEGGTVNPTGRYVWGWQLAGESVLTDRTAMCITPSRQVYYAWGQELSGPTIAQALKQAGCDYAIHLDMNPKHCGFVYTDISGPSKDQMRFWRAHKDMSIPQGKYASWSPKDFFYVTLRSPVTRIQSFEFRPSASRQPTPAWLPGLLESQTKAGTVQVQLLAIERGRSAFRLRSGTREPTQEGGAPRRVELSEAEHTRALVAVNLGHATGASGYGIAFAGAQELDLRLTYATLIVPDTGEMRLVYPGTQVSLAPNEAAVQLPLLARAGKLLEAATVRGEVKRRGALCVTETGRTLVAWAEHDSTDLIANTLLRAGCRAVVELDRGSHHEHFLHRAGTDSPPLPHYETSVLFALDAPMTPTAYRWRPRGARDATTPAGYDSGTLSR